MTGRGDRRRPGGGRGRRAARQRAHAHARGGTRAAAPRRTRGATTPTGLTRAFSGRTARGIVNRFQREHDADAPSAYPEVHHVTSPLRAAARERGDAETINLWAGQALPARAREPAGELVRELAAEARARLRELG